MIEVVRCTCKGTQSSDYQDKMYGAQMRLANKDQKGTTGTCTICGAKHKIK